MKPFHEPGLYERSTTTGSAVLSFLHWRAAHMPNSWCWHLPMKGVRMRRLADAKTCQRLFGIVDISCLYHHQNSSFVDAFPSRVEQASKQFTLCAPFTQFSGRTIFLAPIVQQLWGTPLPPAPIARMGGHEEGRKHALHPQDKKRVLEFSIFERLRVKSCLCNSPFRDPLFITNTDSNGPTLALRRASHRKTHPVASYHAYTVLASPILPL